ncbi:MAG TPA: DUF3048 domain-containing protein [Actinomycetota bacterium]|nr:DUF3048 domain-containing protein [Actinomycetota bacterium]
MGSLLAGAVLLLAACSGDEQPSGGASERKDRPADQKPPSVCPLTGQKFPKGVDGSRPAVAVKIENSTEARPQSGLEDADLVFEEIVEGGITRFMAIYHCGTSHRAGPVRSARFDDPKIALPFTNVIAYSGSNQIVESELKRKRMVLLNELNTEGSAFFRVPPGSTDTHSLFVNVDKLRAQTPKRRKRQPRSGVFDFGALPGKARKVKRVVVNFTASNAIEWRFKGGQWRRWEDGAPFLTKGGGQLAVPNLLVQQVEVNNSRKIVDAAGNPSPDIGLHGSGKAWLLRDGRVVVGRWKVKRPGGAPRFTAKGKGSFTFAKGPIWVELVPSAKGEVKGSVTLGSGRASGKDR